MKKFFLMEKLNNNVIESISTNLTSLTGTMEKLNKVNDIESNFTNFTNLTSLIGTIHILIETIKIHHSHINRSINDINIMINKSIITNEKINDIYSKINANIKLDN